MKKILDTSESCAMSAVMQVLKTTNVDGKFPNKVSISYKKPRQAPVDGTVRQYEIHLSFCPDLGTATSTLRANCRIWFCQNRWTPIHVEIQSGSGQLEDDRHAEWTTEGEIGILLDGEERHLALPA